jgi:sulfite exporter TauE/SafE
VWALTLWRVRWQAGWARGLTAALGPGVGHGLLQLLAALVIAAVGLYLAGWFPQLARLENMGAPLWRCLEPFGRRILPVRSVGQALLFGALWGWLPCGLVYSMLAWSVTAGDASRGSLYLLVFGLGTLPAVFGAGLLAGRVTRLLAWGDLRRAIGALVIVLAVLSLAALRAPSSHAPG